MRSRVINKISIFLLITIVLSLVSCEENNDSIFVADLSSSEITFENSFAAEYLLSEETKDNKKQN